VKSELDDPRLMSLTQLFGTRPSRLKLIADAVRIAELRDTHTLLEVGCGNGVTAVFLSQKYGCHVVGIDSSEKMIASAAKQAKAERLAHKAGFLVADAVNLPFPDSTFNIIICEAAFSIIVDKEMAAKEFRRVLRSGGKLLMLDFVLRKEISKELHSQMPSLPPCLARTRHLDGYIRLFEQAGFQNSYTADYSQEVKKTGWWIAYTSGSRGKLFANPAAQSSCGSKEISDVDSFFKTCQKFSKESELGYALIALTKL
jgi:ubiquinone/menaquinone biosynthesis C-methylase UbiE